MVSQTPSLHGTPIRQTPDELTPVVPFAGSLMNGLQSLPQWMNYFGNPTGARLGVVNAAQSIGSVLSIFLVGASSDRFGRRPVLLAGILMIIAATVIQAASVNYAMFVVSRVIVGFGGSKETFSPLSLCPSVPLSCPVLCEVVCRRIYPGRHLQRQLKALCSQ